MLEPSPLFQARHRLISIVIASEAYTAVKDLLSLSVPALLIIQADSALPDLSHVVHTLTPTSGSFMAPATSGTTSSNLSASSKTNSNYSAAAHGTNSLEAPDVIWMEFFGLETIVLWHHTNPVIGPTGYCGECLQHLEPLYYRNQFLRREVSLIPKDHPKSVPGNQYTTETNRWGRKFLNAVPIDHLMSVLRFCQTPRVSTVCCQLQTGLQRQ